ncbi:hypothetical protein AYL99_05584 [Fonsecaea erecta]|uniref:Oxysterol-binding protein n=1 Tax=Fonsecaea erecta TaxID=1367422 RepID=A0A178ZLR1_9EURO|nr:hypothetical protein AYL99_05584 [Fonsecaea erecta]OAP60582.1 hypothetical protein AYL99_05584 [Fonsecaea erecta]
MLSLKKSIATIRGDLSNITAPPFVLDSKSAVELPAFWAERPAIFVASAAAQEPAERALLVLKWFLASLRNQQYAGRSPAEGVKKPINAFLGEVFLARWEGDQGQEGAGDGVGVTRLVSEQVSHHPPVTACRVWNEKHGVTVSHVFLFQSLLSSPSNNSQAGPNDHQGNSHILSPSSLEQAEGYTRQEITFSGSVNIQQIGHATLHLARHDETYLIPLPDIKIKGLLAGSPYPELQGTHHIPSTSGYTSTIDFIGKGGLFSGADRKHAFEARVYRDFNDDNNGREADPDTARTVYTVSGHWDSQFVIRDARRDVEIETFDVATAPTAPLLTDPLAEQDPWESRRAWRRVREALQRGDMQAAADAKARVENGQREMRIAENNKNDDGAHWQRLFFEPVAQSDETAASLARKVGLALKPDDTVAAWRFRRKEWDEGVFRKPYRGDLMPDNTRASDGGRKGDGVVDDHVNDVSVFPPPPPPSVAVSHMAPSVHTRGEEERRHVLPTDSVAQLDTANNTTTTRKHQSTTATTESLGAETASESTTPNQKTPVLPPVGPEGKTNNYDDDVEQDMMMTAQEEVHQVEEFLRDKYSSRRR